MGRGFVNCRNEYAPLTVVGEFARHVVEIRHVRDRRDNKYPAVKPANATSASAVQGLVRT